jgi:uncharacterized protein (DUF2141 family)
MRSLMLLSSLLVAAPQPPAQPARDVRGPITGSASISGIVVSHDDARRPIRRARVHLINPQVPSGVLPGAVTDDRGAFSLKDLPAGTYSMTINKDGHPTFSYGSTRPGRPGTPLVLAEGQQLTGLTVRFPRGAAITGTVVDVDGKPLPGVMVSAMRYAFFNGQRQLGAAGRGVASDDRGVYRIYNLPAGEYIVLANQRSTGGLTGQDLVATTAADVARAKRELAAPPAAQAAPGVQAGGAAAAVRERGRSVTYAPVYYPGTPVASQATAITVAAGEERGGIDFTVSMVPSSRLEGTVTAPDTVLPENIALALVATDEEATMGPFEGYRSARAGRGGRFAFGSIRPGRYVLTARASSRGAAAPPASPMGMPIGNLWAMTDIVIDGNDMSNVTLELHEGMTVSGRVQFDASELQAPADLSRLRVQLAPAHSGREVSLGAAPAQVDATGAFTITGVAPGRYRITATIPNTLANGARWMLKSSIAGGRDTLDVPIEIRPHQHVSDTVLTFTDRPVEISGVLQDASGTPTSGYQIIVFAEDRAMWTPQSRRIQAVRTAQNGRYTIRNLPPGNYLLVALTDVEQGEWFDPTFLQKMAPSGLRVTLAEGEKKVQDLRLSGSNP